MPRLAPILAWTSLLLGAVACGGSGGDGGASPDGTADGGACDGGACAPVSAASCGPGTRAALGHAECVPVGWTECPDGFEAAKNGWGCAPVLPDAACTGATREAIGSRTCVPIGDCAAPFPPAGASLFVSATGAVDATHFRRIGDALAAARTGDVIAVDDGTYPETLTVVRSVTLAGRCAARVTIAGGGATSEPGIVVGATGVTVRGVTFTGWGQGASVERGSITFEETIFDANANIGVGVVDGASAVLLRSAVRNVSARDSASGFGVQAIAGGRVEVRDSVVARSVGGAVLAGDAGTSLVVDGSVVRDTESDLDKLFGFGVNVTNGATGAVSRSAFLENRRASLRAGPHTKLDVTNTVSRGVREEASGEVGVGLLAIDRATVSVKGFVATGGAGPGVVVLGDTHVSVERADLVSQKGDADQDLGDGAYVFAKGKLDLVDVALVDGSRAGADAIDAGTALSMTRCLVAGTRSSYGDKMGVGVDVAMGASATIASSTIVDNRHSGIYLWENATLALSDTLVRATQKEVFQDRLGHGLLAQESPSVVVDGSSFESNAAVGVALASTSAVVRRSFIRGNAVGIHVQDAVLEEVPDAPDLTPGEVLVTTDTRFVDNGTRVGSGVLPLPDPPGVLSP